jgi:hypothetical protein
VSGYEAGKVAVCCFAFLPLSPTQMLTHTPYLPRPSIPSLSIPRSWAIGLTCASIAESVLRNEARVLPLSVPASGRYGIPESTAASGGVPVYLSLPAVLSIDGVREILLPPLDTEEEQALRKSAAAIAEVQNGLEW